MTKFLGESWRRTCFISFLFIPELNLCFHPLECLASNFTFKMSIHYPTVKVTRRKKNINEGILFDLTSNSHRYNGKKSTEEREEN